jgi:hypothetical protein
MKKIIPQSPKTVFGLQNQYSRVIYPIVSKFYLKQKKGENKPSEPKNEIWAPKSKKSMIVRWKFYIEQAKTYFWVKKAKISHQSPKTEFDLCGFIFAFLTPKIICLLVPYKISDRPYFFSNLEPKFRFWALMAFFHLYDPQRIFFLLKFPNDGVYHTTILILEPKYRFWALRADFRFFEPLSILLLHPSKIFDRLIGHIFDPPSAQPRDSTDSKFLNKLTDK